MHDAALQFQIKGLPTCLHLAGHPAPIIYIYISAIPAELVGRMIISSLRCKSPPHELCPYLNTNGIRMRSKIVPEQKGPDFKTESPLSAKTIETIPLHGRKEAGAIPVPGEADYYAKVPMPHADLAVSPFKTQPKWQTKKGESTSKKVQLIPMQKASGKENRKQRSLVYRSVGLSESEDDVPIPLSPLKTKRLAVQRLTFNSSPARNALVVTQGNIRKPI